jgi:putative DNA primase/helicase
LAPRSIYFAERVMSDRDDELWRRAAQEYHADRARTASPSRERLAREQQNGGAPHQVGPELVIERASDILVKPVEWLWPGRIAIGKFTLLAGEAGLGKSQVVSAIAAAITTGGLWPCDEGTAPPGSVIFFSAEDGPDDTIVPRLMAAGANRQHVHLARAVQTDDGKGRRAFNLQSDLDLLAREIEKLGNVRMVSIDPISAYLGPKIDSHVNAAVRGVLEPIGEMADRLRVAIVGITHPPKGTGTTAINRFIGSIAFVAAARAAFMVTPDPDDKERRLFLPVKNNLAPLGKGLAYRIKERLVGEPGSLVVTSAIEWDHDHVETTADQALQAADECIGSGAKPREEGMEILRELLASGPMLAAKIKAEVTDAGLSWMTVKRAKKLLGVRTYKLGMTDGWLWELPRGSKSPEGAHFQNGAPSGKVEPLRACAHCNQPGVLLECHYGEDAAWLHRECEEPWQAACEERRGQQLRARLPA